MKFKSLVFFFFVTGLLSSCTSSPKVEPADGVFYGNIKGGANQMLFVKKETLGQIVVDTIKIDAQGDFNYTTFLKSPEYFTIFMGRDQFYLYLKPADSLSFNADINSIDEAKFSGASVLYNNYLAQVLKSEQEFSKSMQIILTQSEEKAVVSMDSLKKIMLDELHNLDQNYENIDAKFLEMETERINYYWAWTHVMYPLYYAYYNKDDNFKTSPEYDSYATDIKKDNEAMLELPEYRKYISNLLNAELEDYFKSDSLQNANPSFTVYQFQKINELFNDASVKDYLAFRTMSEHVQYDGVKDYDKVWPAFSALCKNEQMTHEIQSALDEWKDLMPGKPAKDFKGVNMAGDTVKLSDFVGKYVYVDVWATWCNPCLGEIPDLMRIEEEMKDNNIVFISASVDQDKSAWEKMMTERKLMGHQIYVGHSDDLSGYYKISGIPRFMLFDREGKILEVSSDRPSMGVDKKLLALDGI